ncbi:hypothetical protein [Paenibacillus chibensis]|uniref:hypothetical protein n=1 Tax=Paenibacillus chibensis TaxID=59846 RepID=UPI0027D840AC|nr:hypothetical protein [Paenibacillus chibensis]
MEVNIDGKSEEFSQIASTTKNRTLVYEKTGLADTLHRVEIRKIAKGDYAVDLVIDAIDIIGDIFPPNTVIPEPTPNPDPVPTPEPSGDRAILTVTMTTGLEKEYDLSMAEVNAFINWYDAKDAGTGPSKYAIDKHENNKGPFSKRTDYVIFSNILTFEVSEYSTK